MPTKRPYGWIRQPHDARDSQFFAVSRITANLPPTFDLSGSVVEHLDQGSLGSCGPNTEAECIEYDLKFQGRVPVRPSRLFLYYTTRDLMGTVAQDSGVDNRTMLKALNKYGFCPESQWPYTVPKFNKKPTATCYAAALANTITDYAAVTQTPAQMQGTLVSGRPFIFGFDVYADMESDAVAKNGRLPMPRKGATPIGGHDVSIFGYTTVDRPGVKKGNKWPANTYKALNHWTNDDGSLWGDGGFFYVPFAYANNAALASDFWVINSV